MTRATAAIQNEATLLATVRIQGAIEACNWATLVHLAEQLSELAQRGLYHQTQERQAEITKLAMGGHREADPR